MYRRSIGSVKSYTLFIKVYGLGTVIYLIWNNEGRVIVVRCTNVPYILRNYYLAVVELHGVGTPYVRHDVKLPFVCVGHFKNRQHFRKVVLNTCNVHLIEKNEVDVIVVAGSIDAFEDLSFVEILGKFVEVTEKLCTVTP